MTFTMKLFHNEKDISHSEDFQAVVTVEIVRHGVVGIMLHNLLFTKGGKKNLTHLRSTAF